MLASGGYWGAVAAGLDGAVDLHGFDMPGQGKSGAWSPAPDGPDYHTAVTRIAASFIDRPIDLIGHSMGSTVALRIAVAAPDAIRSLTLIEPVLFAAAPDPVQQALDAKLMALLDRGDDEEATRQFISVWGAQPYDDLPPAMQAQMRARIGLIAGIVDAQSHDSANILRPDGIEAIDAPVMVIVGQDSPPVIHSIADALAARMQDVGRAVVPGAGHMVPITHPAETAGLIRVNLDRAA